MLGRLSNPTSLLTSALQLLAIGESEQGLVLRSDRQATAAAARTEGVLTLRIVARDVAQQGDGRWLGQPLHWHVHEEGKALLLSLVSTRSLQGRWQWLEDDEGWCLVIELQEHDGRE